MSRNQTITERLNAVITVKGQAANNPLLSSEQCGFGGEKFGGFVTLGNENESESGASEDDGLFCLLGVSEAACGKTD